MGGTLQLRDAHTRFYDAEKCFKSCKEGIDGHTHTMGGIMPQICPSLGRKAC